MFDPAGARLLVVEWVQSLGSSLGVWSVEGKRQRRLWIPGEQAPTTQSQTPDEVRMDSSIDLDLRAAVAWAGADALRLATVGRRVAMPDGEMAWRADKLTATVALASGRITTTPVGIDLRESDVAKAWMWAFDRPDGPQRVLYADQDGNVAVQELATGRVLLRVERPEF